MFESTITIKGQTTLPKAVRESLAVKAGTRCATSYLTKPY